MLFRHCTLPAAAFAAILAAPAPPLLAAVPAATDSARFDPSPWDALLRAHVDDHGRVAYRDLRDSGRAALARYLRAVGDADTEAWPEREQIAFWLNAYNAGIVAAVLQGRTPEPVLGRVKLFKFWKFRAGGKDRTLDEIEHEILRRRFREPRIHFALVCASTSCPRLRREAYTADRLDDQLEDQGRAFVRDSERNLIDRTSGTLRLSEIFRWFRDDFVAAAGSVQRFVARYVDDEGTRAWLEGDPEVEHLDYDWSLNVQPGQRPR